MEEYLKTIEETVIKACAEARMRQGPEDPEPIDGEKLLEEWKDVKKEWLEKVVDIKQHEDLVSPYEPNQEKGTWTDNVVLAHLIVVTGLSSNQIADHLSTERSAKGDRQGALRAMLMHDLLELEGER